MVPCLLTSTGRLNASRRLSASAELLVKHTIRIKTAWQMSVTVSSTPMIWGFVLPAGHQMLRPWTTPGTSIPDSLTLTFDLWRSWRTVQVEHPWSVWYVFCCGEETAAASLKAIRYSTHCQGITVLYTCTPCVSAASGMNHTCLRLPSRRSWYSFTYPGEMEGWDSNPQPPD